MEENPYAAPVTTSSPLDLTPASAQIRQEHLKHESSIKSIGTLYTLGGLLLIVAAIIAIYGATQTKEAPSDLGTFAILVPLAGLQLWLGLSLRKLKKGARIPAIVMSAIGLIGIPIGTIISIYFLYLLCSKKGKMVFSSEYAQVIAETPGMKYRTSALAWILLLTFILLVVVALFFIVSKSS